MNDSSVETAEKLSSNDHEIAASWAHYMVQYCAHCLAAISVPITLISHFKFNVLSDIDFFDFICDLIVATAFLAIIYFVQQVKGLAKTRNILLIGLSFLYVSFFFDVLDEVYAHSVLIKNVFENSFRVVGLILASIGVRDWLVHNLRINLRLKQGATHDPLTNTYNRRGFLELALHELERAERYGREFVVIFFDIDHFKRINDTYGHSFGDEIIRHVADRASSSLRESDLFCRWGGEEFVLLTPELDLAHGMLIAEKIRGLFEEPITITDNGGIEKATRVTISVGCTAKRPDDKNLTCIMERADQAMYSAKKNGRNKVQSKL